MTTPRQVDGEGSLYGRYAEGATEEAARALAASRRFDPYRHDPAGACSEQAPCSLCFYDAAAAVAAVLVHIETHRTIDVTGQSGRKRSARSST